MAIAASFLSKFDQKAPGYARILKNLGIFLAFLAACLWVGVMGGAAFSGVQIGFGLLLALVVLSPCAPKSKLN